MNLNLKLKSTKFIIYFKKIGISDLIVDNYQLFYVSFFSKYFACEFTAIECMAVLYVNLKTTKISYS